jgi:serine/threonine protein kinase
MLHKDPRLRINAKEALAHPWFNPENKSVSDNVLLEVSANIANLRQEMNVDMRQMNNDEVNMVTCTPLLGRRQMILEPASPLLPMGGNRDATPLMKVHYRPNGDST